METRELLFYNCVCSDDQDYNYRLASRKLSFDDIADEGVDDLLLPCYSLDPVVGVIFYKTCTLIMVY